MAKRHGGSDDKHRKIGNEYDDVELPGLPIAPDGGIAPGFGIAPPPPEPPATPENFVCLRGPCRHYWQMETRFAAGNPEGTFEELGLAPPRAIHRTCLRGHAETELQEVTVVSCDAWDPKLPVELAERKRRRDLYYERHPGHRPSAPEELPEPTAEEILNDEGPERS